MNRFISFLGKIYVPLLFVLLEIVALNYYASSNSYTKAKMLTASNSVLGVVHKEVSGIGDYFSLRRENKTLMEELTRLQNKLSALGDSNPNVDFSASTDIISEEDEVSQYTYISASVINNSVNRQENYLLLDKGLRDGIRISMALVTPELGIVGYVMEVSDKFSVAISVLNAKFHTGGKIKGKEYFGSVQWDGRSVSHVTLSEIPKHADIAVGDTIISGYSSIFPPDISIGVVESFELVRSTYYDARVRLSTDMSRLGTVMVVGYADTQERQTIEGDFFDVEVSAETNR